MPISGFEIATMVSRKEVGEGKKEECEGQEGIWQRKEGGKGREERGEGNQETDQENNGRRDIFSDSCSSRFPNFLSQMSSSQNLS